MTFKHWIISHAFFLPVGFLVFLSPSSTLSLVKNYSPGTSTCSAPFHLCPSLPIAAGWRECLQKWPPGLQHLTCFPQPLQHIKALARDENPFNHSMVKHTWRLWMPHVEFWVADIRTILCAVQNIGNKYGPPIGPLFMGCLSTILNPFHIINPPTGGYLSTKRHIYVRIYMDICFFTCIFHPVSSCCREADTSSRRYIDLVITY